MCLVCHQNLSNESIITSLQESLQTKEFENFNATSISHISIAAIGLNGDIAQDLALQVLEAYISWKNNNIKQEDNSFFGQPSSDRVSKQLELIKKFNLLASKHSLDSNDVRDVLYHPETENSQRIKQLIGNLEDYFVNMIDNFDMPKPENNNNKLQNLIIATKHMFKSIYNVIYNTINNLVKWHSN